MKKIKKRILNEKTEEIERIVSEEEVEEIDNPPQTGLSFNLNLNVDLSEPCSATRELEIKEVKRGRPKKYKKEDNKKQKLILNLIKMGMPENVAKDMVEFDFDCEKIIKAKEDYLKIKCTVSGCDYKSEIGIDCIRKHCEEVHDWGVYKCTANENCHFEAYSKTSLHSHIGSFHKQWNKPGRHERCSKKGCSASFKDQFMLKTHEDIHDNTLQYKCSYCHYKTGHGSLFSDHLAIHFGDIRYVCDICCHVAKNKWSLKLHMELHTETKYKCTICSAIFGTLPLFKHHMRHDHKIKENLGEYRIKIEPESD